MHFRPQQRINSSTQGERFDPQGTFIRKWLPELADVPDNEPHQPHRWAGKQQVLNYPPPIVQHQQARLETLAAFDVAKRGGF